MTFKNFLTLAFLLLLPAPTAFAQVLSAEQSRAQAALAIAELRNKGDRMAAMQAALAGLPAAPVKADIKQYPEAWAALAMAHWMRFLRAEDDHPHIGAISPDGSRALIGRFEQPASGAHLQAQLVDALNMAPIGAPIIAPHPIGTSGAVAPYLAFSPDNRLAAVSFTTESVTIIIDASDGSQIMRVPAASLQPRFSPGGGKLLLTDTVWDARTGKQLSSLPALTAMASWATDDGVVLGQPKNQTGRMSVEYHRLDGMTIKMLDDAPVGRVIAAPAHQVFLVAGEEKYHIYSAEGRPRAEFPIESWTGQFVRGGAAFAVLHDFTGSNAEVRIDVYDLDGNPIPARPEDYTLLFQRISGASGHVVGGIDTTDPITAYYGEGQPTGLELHASASILVNGAAPPGQDAKAPTVDTAVQKSNTFARDAARLLGSGDTIGAIAAALKGLPDTPSEADFIRFGAAHLMLYRAVAARSLKLPIPWPRMNAVGPVPMVGPKGRVMAIGGDDPALYAMPSGDMIAPLLRGDGSTYGSTTYPFFTASGDIVALTEAGAPTVHLYDAATGAHRSSFSFPVAKRNASTQIVPLGFSHDDGAFAVRGDQKIFVANLTDMSVRRLASPPVSYAAWLPERHLLMSVVRRYGDEDGPLATLYVHDGETAIPQAEILEQAGGFQRPPALVAVARNESAALAGGLDVENHVAVIDTSGQILSVIKNSDGVVQFVRNGTAVAYLNPRPNGVEDALKLVSLDGEELIPEFSDYVTFDQNLYGETGALISWHAPPQGAPLYRGEDIPMGAALVEMAKQRLPIDLLNAVRTERVAR